MVVDLVIAFQILTVQSLDPLQKCVQGQAKWAGFQA